MTAPPNPAQDRPARNDPAPPHSGAQPADALDVFVFLAELALLAALAVAGARLGSHVTAIAMGVLLPLAAATLWGVYLAPRSTRRLPHPWRLVAKLALMLVAAALLATSGALAWALAFFATSGTLVTVAELRSPAPGRSAGDVTVPER